jgi:hypothetical protein
VAQTRHREEIINVKLADELAARGLEADAESIQAKCRPDVLVDLKGLKLVVEGRHQKERSSLHNDARERVSKGIGDISLAVEYNDSLYTTTSTKLGEVLQSSTFSGSIFFFSGSEIRDTPFFEKSLSELSDLIRSVFSLIVQDDVVRTQVDAVEEAISIAVNIAKTTNLFFRSEAVRKRLMAALAINE